MKDVKGAIGISWLYNPMQFGEHLKRQKKVDLQTELSYILPSAK